MANVLAELFANTADAIREKTGDTGTMKPAEFPEKIRAIETGGGGGGVANIIPLTITENGKYNVADGVDGYAPVTVNVENKIPEGYIKPTGTVQITENDIFYPSFFINIFSIFSIKIYIRKAHIDNTKTAIISRSSLNT